MEEIYNIEMEDVESTKAFIREKESGVYEGKTIDGNRVIIMQQRGVGMKVSTLQDNGWWRVTEYDADGICESESYEKEVTEDGIPIYGV